MHVYKLLRLGRHVDPELQLCVPKSQCVDEAGSLHNIPDHPAVHTHLSTIMMMMTQYQA